MREREQERKEEERKKDSKRARERGIEKRGIEKEKESEIEDEMKRVSSSPFSCRRILDL